MTEHHDDHRRTRRNLMKAVAIAAAAGAVPAKAVPGKPTIVLVHGAWHGAWAWHITAPLLASKGYEVHTPTLSGLGDRHHLAEFPINLSTHFADVANFMIYEDLKDVVLVGHSFGGKVIAGAAAAVPDRVSRLIYLDAHMATPGRAAAPDLYATFDLDRTKPIPSVIQPIGKAGIFGITDPEQARWADQRFTPHPVNCFTQIYPETAVPPARPRLYIRCQHPGGAGVLTEFLARAQSEPGWDLADIATGHDAMITTPERLTKIIDDWIMGVRS